MNSTPLNFLTALQFSIISPGAIIANSVVEVKNYQEVGRGNVNDPRMGPMDAHSLCETCQQRYKQCPGHFGHIRLAEYVIHPYPKFQSIILKILRSICHNSNCGRCLITKNSADLYGINKISSLTRLKALNDKCKTLIMCEHCKTSRFDIVQEGLKYYILIEGKSSKNETLSKIDSKPGKKVLTPEQIYGILENIPSEDLRIMGFNGSLINKKLYKDPDTFPDHDMYHCHQVRPEWMIFKVLPVMPPCVRPPSVIKGVFYSDDITKLYIQIIKYNDRLERNKRTETNIRTKGRRKSDHLSRSEKEQIYNNLVTCLYNLVGVPPKTKGKSSQIRGKNYRGVLPRVNGKQGIRTFFLGKRVNYSGRSVIGPDSSLSINEIGVPEKMASSLTTPILVNEFNRRSCQQLIDSDRVRELTVDGMRKSLVTPNGLRRQFHLTESLINIKKIVIERFLQDGDILIFNRQPTLHRPSMMGFYVKVMKTGKSIRMPLAVTTPFNADFDGDEMNLHLVRNIEAKAEVQAIMLADKNIMLPQTNSPIIGLVQDGLVGSYLITDSRVEVSRTAFFDCVVCARIPLIELESFYARVEEYYPHVIVSKKYNDTELRYTMGEKCPGRVLYSLSFPSDFYYTLINKSDPDEEAVIIEKGILISGQLEKSIIGAKTNGVIHKIVLEYGSDAASKFLNISNFIVTRYMEEIGFSIGLSDCLCTSKNQIQESLAKTYISCSSILESDNKEDGDKTEKKLLATLNNATNIGQKLSNRDLVRGRDNHFNTCVKSGAKGNYTNVTQVMGIVGQQCIGGKRIPAAISGCQRSLPHFFCGDKSPNAGGFVSNSYLEGLTPTESFFHSMAGREGIIDTAVKSITGSHKIIIFDKLRNRIIKISIGKFIDGILEKYSNKVQHFKENNLEFLKVKEGILIPTVDSFGNVSWSDIRGLTRHDPGETLYEIKTLSGRKVTVTGSKSLLIWNKEKEKYKSILTENVKVGDLVPVNQYLPGIDSVASSIENFISPENFRKVGIIVGFYMAINSSHIKDDYIYITGKNFWSRAIIDVLFRIVYNIESEFFLVKKVIPPEQIDTYCIRFKVPKLCDFITFICGDNKRFSPKIFLYPEEFLIGVLDGYFSENMTIEGTGMFITSSSYDMMVDMNIICSRLGIMGNFARFPGFNNGKYYLLIANQQAKKFIEKIKLSNEGESRKLKTLYEYISHAEEYIGSLNLFSPSGLGKTREESETVGDTIKDKIISIAKVIPKVNSKVYDLTVPKTYNFCLASGLGVRDTSVTGYIQRNIGKVLEDCMAFSDGSIRTMNGNVVQFLYGNDGLDPCHLCYVPESKHERKNIPFFTNVFRLTERINESKGSRNIRPLTKKEIVTLCRPVALVNFHKSPVNRQASLNIQRRLARHLQQIKICPSVLEDLMDEIIKSWSQSIVAYGEPVGLVAATSIGQPTTQSTLNVFHHAGIIDKDVTLGIPRLNELLRATKNPKTPSCTVYIKRDIMQDILDSVGELEEMPSEGQDDNQASEEVNQPKESLDARREEIRKNNLKKRCKIAEKVGNLGRFELVECKDLLITTELLYVGDDMPKISPIVDSFYSYDKFDPEDDKYWWWNFSTINQNSNNKPELWVIKCTFDIDKLYCYKVKLEEIIQKLKINSKITISCVKSPEALGIIIVIVSDFESRLSKLPSSFQIDDLVDSDNLPYFIMRDIVIPDIENAPIKGIKNISKTYVQRNGETDEWYIDTQGSNLIEILSLPFVDRRRTISDDMWEMYNVFGVEVARRFLVNEFTKVLCFDGAYINPRHIELLMDITTRKGTMTSANRHGIDRNVGPMAKACFEQSLENFCLASIYGETDKNRTVISRVATGSYVLCGTSFVDLKEQKK